MGKEKERENVRQEEQGSKEEMEQGSVHKAIEKKKDRTSRDRNRIFSKLIAQLPHCFLSTVC